ncbi:MAG: hypothetical protein FGM43_10210 [Sinobacteraceae bacterium]|nr:hypothetical protein [Nevskiaceae bacterium]
MRIGSLKIIGRAPRIIVAHPSTVAQPSLSVRRSSVAHSDAEVDFSLSSERVIRSLEQITQWRGNAIRTDIQSAQSWRRRKVEVPHEAAIFPRYLHSFGLSKDCPPNGLKH